MIKASQIISSDIDMEKLLINITNVIVEIAGAQKCTLFFIDRITKKLNVQSSYKSNDRGEVEVLKNTPLEFWKGGSISVIEYVKNSCQSGNINSNYFFLILNFSCSWESNC